ncbi:MAG TPA: triose-phosphate isomerase [Bryobacterales bacterium]|nr:triose-phosphate isomerase [Bryobacterales bacterium]
MSKRIPVIAGNWKMYKTVGETVEFFEKFKPLVEQASHCEIVIAPPFPALAAAAEAARGSNIRIGAQNVHWEKEGAFTGEVSAPMLAGAGCTHVIIGHSERRQYFGETNATVSRRLGAALAAGLTPVVCIGERLEEREAECTAAVLIEQFDGAFAALTPAQFSPILIAYEPVWAIGTGRTATPEIAAAAHRLIRDRAAGRFGSDAAEKLRILYGGSVKPDNIRGLMARPEIDGALVGGASLDPRSMASIVNF